MAPQTLKGTDRGRKLPGARMSEISNPLLEVRGLVKDYPGVRALGGVDLTVTSGQVHCLIGQNGAGKSTLIKCVSGLVEPTAGEVRRCSPIAGRRGTRQYWTYEG